MTSDTCNKFREDLCGSCVSSRRGQSMKLGLVACLGLVLSACRPVADPVRHLSYTAHNRPEVNTLTIPVWFDDRLPMDMRYATRDALGQWNLALNGYLEYVIQYPDRPTPNDSRGSTPAEIMQWRIDHEAEILVVKAAAETDADYPEDGVLGWVDGEQPNVLHVLVGGMGVSVDGMRTVLMHEIGHTLGLRHTKVDGLLFPYRTNQPTCIDHTVIQALAAMHEWDDRRMNWCE